MISSWYICPMGAAKALGEAALHEAKYDGVMVGWGYSGDYPTPGTLVIAQVVWENPNRWVEREQFEAQPGVVPFGDPWEPVPAAAVPMLEFYRQRLIATRAERVGAVATRALLATTKDVSAPIDTTHTVADAMRKAQPLYAWYGR